MKKVILQITDGYSCFIPTQLPDIRHELQDFLNFHPKEQARLLKKINEYVRHLSDHRWNGLRRRIKVAVSTEIG